MPRVGEAFVEIEGDYRELADNGARKIEQAFDKVGRDLELDGLTEAFGKAGDEAGEKFTVDANGRLRNSKGHFVKSGQTLGKAVSQGVKKGIDDDVKSDSSKGGIFGRIFGKLDDKFGGAADTVLDKIKSVLDPKKLAKLAGGGLADLAFMTAKFGGLAGVVFQASSALLSFSGVLFTLPGVLASVGLAGGTLAIAFSGLGDAISAVASGDTEKLNEALKKLPPAARNVVRELGGIIPVLKDIRSQVQQNFFEQFEGGLTRLTTKLGGVFGEGFGNLATTLGILVDQLISKLSSPKGQQFFTKLFDTANGFVQNVGPPLLNLLGRFGDAFEKTLPFVDTLFAKLGEGLDKFAGFIDEKVADGSFEQFLTNAFETASLLGDAIVAVIDLLKSMFKDSNETGNEFLESFTKAIQELTDYFNSKPGKEALETLVFLGKLMAAVILTIIRATLGWLTALNRIWQAIKNVYQTFKAAFGLYKEMTGAGGALANAFRAGASKLPGFAVGGIVDRPTIAHVGEAGPEAIIPLTNPKRAREVMEDAGLVSIAAGLGGSDNATVIVYLGTEQITDILDVRVDKGLARAARDITRGDRPD